MSVTIMAKARTMWQFESLQDQFSKLQTLGIQVLPYTEPHKDYKFYQLTFKDPQVTLTLPWSWWEQLEILRQVFLLQRELERGTDEVSFGFGYGLIIKPPPGNSTAGVPTLKNVSEGIWLRKGKFSSMAFPSTLWDRETRCRCRHQVPWTHFSGSIAMIFTIWIVQTTNNVFSDRHIMTGGEVKYDCYRQCLKISEENE